jgi:polyphosphate kinase
MFDRIKEGDFILHVPYDAFDPTVELVQAAARDENVLAIKMTLYRTNRDSAIIQALQEAASNKKQVTILVEIKARFDEENNIRWAKELEMRGCHVIYGLPGLKVHSKMLLIVRKEEGMINRYVHLSTGNYNEHTAKLYTDIGYFTDNEDFARDISDVFNMLTGYSKPASWSRIITAPDDLRNYSMMLIDREIRFHKKNKNGAITIKLNSLEDPQIIEKLYEASQAGVKVRLIVRGICCLVPGVKGLSENITVRSIVGRFLEHTRVFVFNNNGTPRVFLSSADWMKRNFDRRIELLFELYTEGIKEQLKALLELCLRDNTKAWELLETKVYKKMESKEAALNVQEQLIKSHGGTGTNAS